MAGNQVSVKITADDQLSAKLESIKARTIGVGTALGNLATDAIYKVQGGLFGAIKTAADFEYAVDQVGAVANATAAEMEGLSRTALRIGKATSFSASEAASAMEMLAANGVLAADIMNGAADAAVALAAAGGTDLATAADVASTAMAVWGLKSDELGDVVNRLAGAANVSRFGVEDMALAIAQGGGAAAAAGVEFSDFSTAIAAIAPSFSSGSDAGTSFKTMMQSLVNPTDKQASMMKDLGLMTELSESKFFDATGAMKSMAEISGLLNTAMADLSEEQRLTALDIIFGSDAMRAAGAIMKLTADDFRMMDEAMRNTDAAEVAAQRMGNFNGALESLKGSLEVIAIEVGMKVLPALSAAALYLADKLPVAFEAMKEPLARLRDILAGFASTARNAFEPLVDFAGKKNLIIAAVGAVTALTVALGAMAVAAVAANLPLFATIGVIAGIGAGIALLVTHWDELTRKYPQIQAATEQVKESFAEFTAWVNTQLLPAVRNIGAFTEAAVRMAVSVVQEYWPQISAIVMPIINQIVDHLTFMWTTFRDVVQLITALIKGDWSQAWEEFKQIIGGVAAYFKETFDNLLAFFSGYISLMYDTAHWIGKAIVNGIKDGIAAVWDSLVGWVKGKINDLVGFIKDPLGIRSPSRVMADEVGKPLVQGIQLGMEQEWPVFLRHVQAQLIDFRDVMIQGLKDGAELTLPELESFLAQLSNLVQMAPLPDDARAMGIATVEEFVRGVKDRKGLANQEVIDFIDGVILSAVNYQTNYGGMVQTRTGQVKPFADYIGAPVGGYYGVPINYQMPAGIPDYVLKAAQDASNPNGGWYAFEDWVKSIPYGEYRPPNPFQIPSDIWGGISNNQPTPIQSETTPIWTQDANGNWTFAVPQSFQHGTSYVPRTGLALLHQGEAVVPAGQNRGGMTINIQALDAQSFEAWLRRGGGDVLLRWASGVRTMA